MIKQQRTAWRWRLEYVSNSWSQKNVWPDFLSHSHLHFCFISVCIIVYSFERGTRNLRTYFNVWKKPGLEYTPFLSEHDFFFFYPSSFSPRAKVFMLWFSAFVAIFIFLMSVSHKTCLHIYIHFLRQFLFCCSLFFCICFAYMIM